MHAKILGALIKDKKIVPALKNSNAVFRNVLKDCLKVSGEKILVIGDPGFRGRRVSATMTAAYALAAERLGLDVEVVLQKVKAGGERADRDVVDALFRLPNDSVVILNLSNRLGSVKYLGKSFRMYARSKNCRFITTSGLGDLKTHDFFHVVHALDIDYSSLKRRAAKVKRALDGAREVRVVTPAGTDIFFNVHKKSAIAIDGSYERGGGNMPAGEVYIAPNFKGVNGMVVVDGSSRWKLGTSVISKPIKMEVRKGLVVRMWGGKEMRLLRWTLNLAQRRSKFPSYVRHVSELGIGLNPHAKIIGSMIVDEKSLGTAHIALGSNAWFGGDVYSPVHLDHVFRNPVIYVDGDELKI